VATTRIPPRWFEVSTAPIEPPRATTVTEAFLEAASRDPTAPVVADERSGVKTFRDIVAAVLVLRQAIERLPGERLGIMLPASVAADATYLACLFAGKVPVMVNWTLGSHHVVRGIEIAGLECVVTARALVNKLATRGLELAEAADRLVFLEDLAGGVGAWRKAWALAASRLTWRSLRRTRPPATAVILFTSGSESLPKAVPLSHQNMLQNLISVMKLIPVARRDCLLGFLPPFHAFGITVLTLGPLCFGMRAAYHPNPTEGAALGTVAEKFKPTIVLGTPTLLSGMVRRSRPGQLASLRLIITGGEKCPGRVHDLLAARCPQATIVEGYGVTECSPIVAVNTTADPRRGTIGRLLPGFERLYLDPQSGRPLEPPCTGVLHVRGPCVFDGYLNYDGPSPFVEHDGKRWYCTGDIISEDAEGILTFQGRLKRFVKMGGEMVSLPAIEAVLRDHYASEEGPVLAVGATSGEGRPQLVLFTTKAIGREEANAVLRQAGFSPLHFVRRVVRLDELPLLGTGKVNYRALKTLLSHPEA